MSARENKSELKITIMGCGNSTGVPAAGGYWGACDLAEPKNKRMRASIAVQSADTTLVIDTGPDFRHQVNEAGITQIDAVLYTHAHGDHVNGMDDLRPFSFRQKMLVPVYGDADSLREMEQRFHYLFRGGASEIYRPVVEAREISPGYFGRAMDVAGIRVVPFLQDHGNCQSVGYRFGDFGYSLDMLDLGPEAIETLRGIRTWVVDCTAYRDEANKVHAHIDRVIDLNARIGAEKVYLSSLSLAMDYQTLCGELPPGYAPAYDGLILTADIYTDR